MRISYDPNGIRQITIHMMKKKHLYLFAALFTLGAYLTYEYGTRKAMNATDEFFLAKIQSTLTFNPEYNLEPLPEKDQQELACALTQNYTYLGHGGQCFAFVSEDNRYVLKFLNHSKRRLSFYSSWPLLPTSLQKRINKKTERKKEKQQRDFTSYLIAIRDLQEQTGMIFVHLNKTTSLHKTIVITDKKGEHFTIHLDHYEFLLQKKADNIYNKIRFFMDNSQQAKAESLIDSLITSLIARSKKSIIDDDAILHKNFGCIDDKCLFIDVGRFRKDPRIADPTMYIEDIYRITTPFTRWLKQNYSELDIYLDGRIQELRKKSTNA